MTKFINCSFPVISSGRYETVNPPVNIDLVTHIKKSRHAYYPDNTGISTIEFHFSENHFVRWFYPVKMIKVFKKEERRTVDELYTGDRDAEFDKIVSGCYES